MKPAIGPRSGNGASSAFRIAALFFSGRPARSLEHEDRNNDFVIFSQQIGGFARQFGVDRFRNVSKLCVLRHSNLDYRRFHGVLPLGVAIANDHVDVKLSQALRYREVMNRCIYDP